MPLQEEGTTTRRQLIELLRTSGGCGIAELSGALGLTEMGVRRHLHRLERDGLVRSTSVRQAMGRPSFRYRLTETADDLFPKNYPYLTLELLGELEELSGTETVDRLFEGRRAKLEAKYRERMRGKALQERVAELTAIQNTGGYMASWEANPAGGYVLYEHNCPIAQVANRYRQACRCEKALFGELLDADVERTECFADGGNRCTYAIRTASAAAAEPK